MNTKELQDNALNTIVGGSTYMTELKDYLHQGNMGACFNISFSKGSGLSKSSGTASYPATDAGFRAMIILANNYGGKITLYDAKGRGKVFTDKQLDKMRWAK